MEYLSACRIMFLFTFCLKGKSRKESVKICWKFFRGKVDRDGVEKNIRVGGVLSWLTFLE